MMHNDLLFTVLVAHICLFPHSTGKDDSGGLAVEGDQDHLPCKDISTRLSLLHYVVLHPKTSVGFAAISTQSSA